MTCTIRAVFGVLAAAWLLASGPAAAAPISDTAKRHFKAGVELLRDSAGPRYEEAYHAFKAAYRDSPSPKILGNIGLCAMMLERDGEAIAAYKKYLDEAGARDETERKQIQRDLTILESSLVPVELSVSPGDSVLVDTRQPVKGPAVVNRYSARNGKIVIGIRAGQHRFRLRGRGHESVEWDVDARPGKPIRTTVTLRASSTPPRRQPAAASMSRPSEGEDTPSVAVPVWVMASITLAGGAAAGVVGGLALANKADFKDALAAGDNDRARDLRPSGETLNIVTDVLLVTTTAAALATLVLYFSSATGPAAPVPLVGATARGGMVGVQGAF